MDDVIRGSLGFGQCDVNGAALSFDLPLNAGNLGFSAFDALVATSGGTGSGLAAQKWNHNQMFTRVFDVQAQWAINFDLMPFFEVGSPGGWAQDKFLQLSNSASGDNVLALEIETDGTIAAVTGGDGTTGTGVIVKKTTATFPTFAWATSLELLATGLGGSATIQVWQNDVIILSVVAPTVAGADSIALGSQNGTTDGVNSKPYFGVRFANLVFTDGQGPAPWNTRLGPVRVTTLSPTADAGGNWNITPNTITNRFQAVDDLYPTDGNGSPDFDHSYIGPVTSDAQYFTLGPSPCYGLVLGVNVCLAFRGASGSTTCDAMLIQQSTITNLGTATVTGPIGMYKTRQIFVGFSPASGTYFTDAEIGGSLWGASTSSPGLLLTQVFLEKIVSLRATPYSCGGSSYSF